MGLDKFYTKIEVAGEIIKKIDLLHYKTIIEPSAGNGSFLNFLPKNTLALDIEPESENIIKQDYFSFDFSQLEKPILVVGNPPFGKRSKLAIDFFNYSAVFADTIAFVVPAQFNKWSVQSKLEPSFCLASTSEIPKKSFFYNEKTYNINCCFQIWNKDGENLRIRNKPQIKHKDFEMWQYNNTKQALKYFNKDIYKWDFAIPRQGFYDYNIKIENPNLLNKKIQWIFFKAKNKEAFENLHKINFEKLSRKNTTTPGFGKADVVEEYNNLFTS